MMNKEQYEILKDYEFQLTQAYKGNYLVGMGPKMTRNLIDMSNEVFNENQQYTTCSHCLYKIVRRLGEEYFKYQERLAEVTPTAGNDENKRGRKRKEK